MNDKLQNEALADLGKYIRTQRQIAQLSLRHLARVSTVSDSCLSQLERGRYQPSGEVLKAIAYGLQIPPDVLFRLAGWLPDDAEAAETNGEAVVDAIVADTRLSQAQRSALVQLCRSMVGDD